MTTSPTSRPVLLLPGGPFNFVDKWKQPIWKRCGVYLWSIEIEGAYLVSYAGQVFGSSRNFDQRIWEEYKWWRDGNDHPVDIEKYLKGERRELAQRPYGHTEREIKELTRVLRLWLMPLDTGEECTQAERWLVKQLCRTERTRQFLANRKPESYIPMPGWEVQFRPPKGIRFHGLPQDDGVAQ